MIAYVNTNKEKHTLGEQHRVCLSGASQETWQQDSNLGLGLSYFRQLSLPSEKSSTYSIINHLSIARWRQQLGLNLIPLL